MIKWSTCTCICKGQLKSAHSATKACPPHPCFKVIMVLHTGVKEFRCKTCSKEFTHKYMYKYELTKYILQLYTMKSRHLCVLIQPLLNLWTYSSMYIDISACILQLFRTYWCFWILDLYDMRLTEKPIPALCSSRSWSSVSLKPQSQMACDGFAAAVNAINRYILSMTVRCNMHVVR